MERATQSIRDDKAIRLLALVCIATSLAAFVHLRLSSKGDQFDPSAPGYSSSAHEVLQSSVQSYPVSVRPLKSVSVCLDAEQTLMAVQRVMPRQRSPLGGLMHAAMVLGLDMEIPWPSRADRLPSLKEVIYSNELATAYFGSPIFVETQYGLHNRLVDPRDSRFQLERQSHWGQLLSEFAKHGIPLTQELTTDTGTFAVRDILQDTVANYNTNDPQIEWVCIALAMYLPPQRTWVNKFGHRFHFDQMADELMRRQFNSDGLACHGIHLLEALAVLLRADFERPVLSESRRAMIRQHLGKHVTRLTDSQLADGSWPVGWHAYSSPAYSVRNSDSPNQRHLRVHVTGHHVDWMYLVLPDMLPSDEVFQRAAEFLQESLLCASQDAIQEHYCPYCHAAHALVTLLKNAVAPSE